MPRRRYEDDPRLDDSVSVVQRAATSSAEAESGGATADGGPGLIGLQEAAGNQAVRRLMEGQQLADAAATLAQSPEVAAVKVAAGSGLGMRVPLDLFLADLLHPQGLLEPEPERQNPAPLPGDKAKYARMAGSAYGTGTPVSPQDVVQGGLGDCYLMSMMIAIARVRPDVLASLVKDNGDGTFDVTLYEEHLIGGATPYTERISDEVPVDNDGNPLYAQVATRPSGTRPYWPALIEKAYAKHKGGYADIEGGWGTDAAQLLTKGGGKSFEPSDHSLADIAKMIDADLKKGAAITAGSINRRYDDLRNWLEDKTGLPTTDISETQRKFKIIAPHEYVVKSVDVAKLTIDLINPWGHDHLTDLPLSAFQVAFGNWTVVDLGPAPKREGK